MPSGSSGFLRAPRLDGFTDERGPANAETTKRSEGCRCKQERSNQVDDVMSTGRNGRDNQKTIYDRCSNQPQMVASKGPHDHQGPGHVEGRHRYQAGHVAEDQLLKRAIADL